MGLLRASGGARCELPRPEFELSKPTLNGSRERLRKLIADDLNAITSRPSGNIMEAAAAVAAATAVAAAAAAAATAVAAACRHMMIIAFVRRGD